MVAHYSLTLTGSVQRLSSVIPTGTAVPVAHFVSLQAAGANTGLIYVGGFPQLLSSTAYGFRIEIPASTIPSAPSIIELGGGAAINLADLQVLGTNNDILKIMVLA